MSIPLPSLTKAWHSDTYSSISPNRPSLSAAGKTVIITGAGSGIGREIAIAWASAHAAKIALLGRRAALLDETKDLILQTHKEVKVSVHALDVIDTEALKKTAAEVGTWDVLILNAAYLPPPAPVATADPQTWWQGFQTNVLGNFLPLQAFHNTRNVDGRPVVIGVGSAVVSQPLAIIASQSSYTASKIAQTKLLEVYGEENPDVFVACIHPGLVVTGISKASGWPLDIDRPQLPAHFTLWLASEEAAFLKNRFVWANWDVEELMAMKDKFEGTRLAQSNMVGWPYEHVQEVEVVFGK